MTERKKELWEEIEEFKLRWKATISDDVPVDPDDLVNKADRALRQFFDLEKTVRLQIRRTFERLELDRDHLEWILEKAKEYKNIWETKFVQIEEVKEEGEFNPRPENVGKEL